LRLPENISDVRSGGPESFSMVDFIHPELNASVQAIGGHYVFIKEERLDVETEQVLYHVGYAVIDSSCCGAGGTAYASVAGYIRRWHGRLDKNNRPVSEIEPIRDHATQNYIRRLITARESVPQVDFI
jgi:hypothetical protein